VKLKRKQIVTVCIFVASFIGVGIPVIWAVLWAYLPPSNEQLLSQFSNQVKKEINASELQQWAITMLHQAPVDANKDIMIPADQLPASIRTLRSRGLEIEMAHYDDYSSPENNIWLEWGGGWRHWGIRVGPESYKIPNGDPNNKYLEWKPGLYFFVETQ
jgi:hypothetical protein